MRPAASCGGVRRLLDADHHRVRPHGKLDAASLESGLLLPADAAQATIIFRQLKFKEGGRGRVPIIGGWMTVEVGFVARECGKISACKSTDGATAGDLSDFGVLEGLRWKVLIKSNFLGVNVALIPRSITRFYT